ncbi:NAD-dependent protein deacylase [Aerococcaceae bacterium DSM 111176]|nr:NAD-dependent protein deacylase [Aerococcaceae bacterium DSM 111176]
MTQNITKLQQALNQSQNIVFFSGAGMSTQSGIPDFRSSDGIFMQETGHKYTPEQVISYSFFKQYPEIYFDFHFNNLVYQDAEPNEGHKFIADLEKTGKHVAVVTQNIDELHQKAGSQEVYELHGNVMDNYCTKCQTYFTIDQLQKDDQGVPRCPHDNGIVRPNIVMYEEQLDQNTVKGAIQAIKQADMLVILGTSLIVYPAAGFVQYFEGEHLAVINKTPIKVNNQQEVLAFEDTIDNIFGQLEIEGR